MQVALRGRLSRIAPPRVVLWSSVFLITAIPVLLGIWLIATFGVDVPYWDEWENVVLLQRLYSGTLAFRDLFAQHMEHRIVFPQIIMLVAARLTRYSTVVDMYISLAFLTGAVAALLAWHRRTFGSSIKVFLLFLPVSWLMFNWRQWESLLWGYALQIFLAQLCVVGCVLILNSPRLRLASLFGAVVVAYIGTFSFAAAILIWPVGALQLAVLWFLTRQRRQYGPLLALWATAGCIATVLYFVDYQMPVVYWPRGLRYVLAHPKEALIFNLVLLGNPLARDGYGAIACGVLTIVLIVIAAILLRWENRSSLRNAVPGAMLVVFALMLQILITSGRMGLGPAAALVSRYATLGNLGIVGVYFIYVSYARTPSYARVALLGGVTALLIIGILLGYGSWIPEIRSFRTERLLARYALLSYEFQNDTLLNKLYLNPDIVRERAAVLKTLGYSVFARLEPASAPTPCSAETRFNIDTVNGAPAGSRVVIHRNQTRNIEIDGWASNQQQDAPADSVYVVVDNKIEIPAMTGISRPDVGNAYRNRALGTAGFRAIFSAAVLGDGEHKLALKLGEDRGLHSCITSPEKSVLVLP